MKTLVVWYSYEGSTRSIGNQIADALHADRLELALRDALPDDRRMVLSIGAKQALIGECPDLLPIEPDVLAYDRIIIGTPVWAGRCAPALLTFLTKYCPKEKVTAVFATSKSGHAERCIQQLTAMLPNLTESVSLYDLSVPYQSKNKALITEFVQKLL